MDRRTETERVFVNPDGTFTWEQATLPRRVLRDGSWEDIDTTLRAGGNGRVQPAATALDVSFSGGGDSPLVVVEHEDVHVEIDAPFDLPAPALEGNSATYADVLPSVDLVVTATPESFSHVLVVRNPEAASNPALERLNFPTEVQGGRLSKDADQSIDVLDTSGEVVLDGPPPSMWDSSGDAPASGGSTPPATVAPADHCLHGRLRTAAPAATRAVLGSTSTPRRRWLTRPTVAAG